MQICKSLNISQPHVYPQTIHLGKDKLLTLINGDLICFYLQLKQVDTSIKVSHTRESLQATLQLVVHTNVQKCWKFCRHQFAKDKGLMKVHFLQYRQNVFGFRVDIIVEIKTRESKKRDNGTLAFQFQTFKNYQHETYN